MEISQLSEDYQSYSNNSLETQCIKKILDFSLDLSNYDLIDAIHNYKVGPFIISYQLINNFCEKIKLKHLFDQFLNIYSIKLTTYLDALIKDSQICDQCYRCEEPVINDNDSYDYKIGICKKNHKCIWTNCEIEDPLFTKIQNEQNNGQCSECITKLRIMELPENYKVTFNSDGNLLITEKTNKSYDSSIRRNKPYCSKLINGVTFYKYTDELITLTVYSCDSYCRMDSDRYLEDIYSMYQQVIFSDQEEGRIDRLLNPHNYNDYPKCDTYLDYLTFEEDDIILAELIKEL